MKLLIFFLFSCFLSARVVVISDIDDTIKKSNTLDWSGALQYFFKGEEFPGMQSLYKDIERADESYFHYVSASFRFLYDAQDWVSKKGFPVGTYHQKKISSGETYSYKYIQLRRIVTKYDASETFFYFMGDNSAQDILVYKDIKSDFGLNGEIYIRDVQVNAFPLTNYLGTRPEDGVYYFLSEYDLLKTPLRRLMSLSTVQTVAREFMDRSGVAGFIKEQSEKRLVDVFCDQLIPSKSCRNEVQKINQEVWLEYYSL